MCRELDALRQSIVAYGGRFDARSLTPGEAGAVVRLCAQMESSIASVKALAAARAAEGNAWHVDGFRSPAHQLADQAGMSPSAAKRALDTGRRMAEQADVAQAALAGELSPEQAAAVSDGVAANPAKAKELIDKAKQCTVPELYEEIARTKAAATDQEARHRAIHVKRSLRRWTDRDGASQGHIYGHPEDAARLWRMLDPIRRRLIMLRRGSEPNESLDALDYDALMIMAGVAAGQECELSITDLREIGLFPQLDGDAPPKGRRAKKLAGSPARVMVRVDLDSLLRGFPIDGELCEIAGYGPVPVSVIEDLLANDNAFLVGVLTKAEQLIGVYHPRRRPNAYQRSALDFLYPSCTNSACDARAGLQYDHREDWAKTKITGFDLLDRLCGHCHDLKTLKGWALVEGRGKRAFVPPDDPRHPRHSRPP